MWIVELGIVFGCIELVVVVIDSKVMCVVDVGGSEGGYVVVF